MYKILLATLTTSLLLSCNKDTYRFVGPEDSPEKNRYIIAMEPIHTDGLQLIPPLRRATVKWGQQASSTTPDWNAHQATFFTLSKNIQEIINRTKAITPEKDDLLPPHENYLKAWMQCQEGVTTILAFIESKGQQGSTLDAMTSIDQSIKSIELFPNSLERHAILVIDP